MTDEWPDHLEDRGEYNAWVKHLADNARQAAAGRLEQGSFVVWHNHVSPAKRKAVRQFEPSYTGREAA